MPARSKAPWVGYGTWKPLPSAKPAPPSLSWTKASMPMTTSPSCIASTRQVPATPSSSASGPPPDPDRPTLHKTSGTDDPAFTASASPAADPDQPDPAQEGHPTPRPAARQAATLIAPCCTRARGLSRLERRRTPAFTDPDRPRLLRGKPTGNGPDVLPSLMGLPADMHQAVAVSDAKTPSRTSMELHLGQPGRRSQDERGYGGHRPAGTRP